ncbi:hypothetical protein JCM10212_004859 [Sporobolomyces blumeae]
MFRTAFAISRVRVAVAPQQFAAIGRSRFVSTSPVSAKSPGEGVGEKVPVEDENPVSARAKGVKNAVKEAAGGAQKAAKKATGQDGSVGPSNGFEGKYQNEEEVEKGRKHGLAKKGEEQGGL